MMHWDIICIYVCVSNLLSSIVCHLGASFAYNYVSMPIISSSGYATQHTSCHYYWIIQDTRGIVAMYISSSTISWLTCDNVLYMEQVKWMYLCVSVTHRTPLTAIGNNVSMAWRD